jgi:ribosome modulation factor
MPLVRVELHTGKAVGYRAAMDKRSRKPCTRRSRSRWKSGFRSSRSMRSAAARPSLSNANTRRLRLPSRERHDDTMCADLDGGG